ncbi:fimbrillin family protein [Bacteroides sp.]
MIHKRVSVRLLSLFSVCLIASCSGDDFAGAGADGLTLLQPVDGGSLSLAESRSIVNGTATTAATDKISSILVYLTYTDHTKYPGFTAGGQVFNLQSGGKWTSATPVYISIQQYLYACSPSGLTITHNNTGKHTVPVSVSAEQTFDGNNEWNCTNTDYLYGSASNTVGEARQIMASRTNPSPAIYLQHALSQIVFSMENASGRIPDPDYDYVKSISLKANDSGVPFQNGNATMQLADGVLTFSQPRVGELKFTPSANPVQVGDVGRPSTVAYGLVAPRAAFSGTMTLTIVLGKVGDPATERELSVSTSVFNAEWTKGNRYIYKLSLGDREISISGVSIAGWGKVTGSGSLLPERD